MLEKYYIAEEYLSIIEKELYSLSSSNNLLEQLRDDLYTYVENNPNYTMDDLELEFGNPKDIAKDFLESNKNLHPKRIAKNRRKKNIIIAVLAIVLLLVLIIGGTYLHKISVQRQAMATDVIIIDN